MPLPLLAVPAIAQGVTGLGQFLFSGKRKAQREMEEKAKQSPTYTGGGSIMDYYNRALQRASTGLTDTAAYKTQMQNLQAGTAQGINALQDRRSALSGVNALIGNQNKAEQNAVVNAEQEQNRRFNQLGNAAQMKTGVENQRYQYNQLNPYLRQFQLSQQKAAAAANTQQTGLQNLFGAVSNAAAGGLFDKATGATKVTNTPIANMPKPSILKNYVEPTAQAVNAVNSKPLGVFNVPSQYAVPYSLPAYNNANYNWIGK